MATTNELSSTQFLSGGGEMGELIRSMDWSATPLGPIESWPQSLRTSVNLCLSSTFPILIAWGPKNIQIYNDSYRPICGAKHPNSMGQNFRECWESALPVVGVPFDKGQQGEGTYIKDQRMFLDRYGYMEEAFMTFSFAPIRDETGSVGGIFHPITETTDKMLSARRTRVLRDLGADIIKAKSVKEIGLLIADKYEDYELDLPFLAMYQLDADGKKALLSHYTGFTATSNLYIPELKIDDCRLTAPLSLEEVLKTKNARVFNNLSAIYGDFNCGPYEESPESALILPLQITGQEDIFGFVIAGVSRRRMLDEAYINFYQLLGSTYNTAISTIYAYEQEQKRAIALAEIDLAKTTFFSNVSHEFRTPLTLMLGPLEEIMKDKDFYSSKDKESVESIERNAQRLLKLVNNLLDYSRVEAGRIKATYQPLDFTELTEDLASGFRSVIEKAGLNFNVHCNVLTKKIYADKSMWEKIVLNLLINAFNYTLRGSITVNLEQQDEFVSFEVIDTGIGISAKDLPLLFERFYRVENAVGRTHKGSGIGLSLVSELVKLHHGTITVNSIEGRGSSFIVHIPTGKKHLPPQQVQENLPIAISSQIKDLFAKESMDILMHNDTLEDSGIAASIKAIDNVEKAYRVSAKILIVDDNADMRAYLYRILSPYFDVFVAVNGKDALKKIHYIMPDLVLSDIMMPVMDGKKMLNKIKENPTFLKIPVIFLSARAGEEARIDGLDAGADDYLVKPFSAAELLSKIRTQIKISSSRMFAEQKLRNLLNNAPVAIALYRGSSHILEMANEKMLNYLDKTAEQILHQPIFEVMPELKTEGFDIIMDTVLNTGIRHISVEIPLKLFRPYKPLIAYVNITIEALVEENNVISGLMVVASDVTEQVTARKDLEKVTDTLKLAIDGAGIGTWNADLISGKLTVSERTKIIHGWPDEVSITVLQSSKQIEEEHRNKVLLAIETAVKENKSFDEVFSMIPLNSNKKKWIRASGKAYYDAEGLPTNMAGTVIDITEQMEDELRKNDFIGMVSHELKTPLTSLNGYAQILHARAKINLDVFTVDTLGKMMNQVKKMSTMINGFLDISRLESGKIHLNKSLFDINKLIIDIIEETQPMAASHLIIFSPGKPAILNADRDKIGSVLSNLLSNAIKYTSNKKPIAVYCELIDNKVIIYVKDEGMGIRQHDIEKLFQRFYRVDNTESQHIAGFGIGLYLSAEIIQHHQGNIGVKSEVGFGSVFHFELPLNDETPN